jgi:membrane protease YdiL (CAAX protease family)
MAPLDHGTAARRDWRWRSGAALGTRPAAAGELALAVALTLGHRYSRIVPVDESLLLFVVGWASLWLRGVGFRGVGLARPSRGQVGVGAVAGLALQASSFVSERLIAHVTGQVADLSQFLPLVGSVRHAVLYLALVWTWAAFGEELTYRGYLLNRVADLGGGRRSAWLLGLVFVSALFGIGHSYQGLAGMLDTGLHGAALAALYLACGRNLWPCIVAHGVSDTAAIALIYFGVGIPAGP